MTDTIGSLPEIRPGEALLPELAKCVYPSESWGRVLHHPLFISAPYSENMNSIYNDAFTEKCKYIEEKKKQRKWHAVLVIHERPYRVQTFLELEPLISDEDYWRVVRYLWIDTENVWQQKGNWRKIWRSKRPGRETVMSEQERAILAAMPDQITVYRGTYTFPDGIRGSSWTIDRDRAIWFSNRWRPREADRYLVTGQVAKRNVIAFFDHRNEDEIVAFPEHVKNAEVEKLAPKDQIATPDHIAALMNYSSELPTGNHR